MDRVRKVRFSELCVSFVAVVFSSNFECQYSLFTVLSQQNLNYGRGRTVNIVYVIESAAYGVLFTSCLCQKPERARNVRVRVFDTNNE